MQVKIETLDKKILEGKGVFRWPVWEKEVSRFDWHYDSMEECYILEGEITITAGNKKWEIKPGDFVSFPKGLDCEWNITKSVRKHYNFP